MRLPPFNTLKRHPLTYFTVGSMVVLFVCATATCLWFTKIFLEKERHRAETSLIQLRQAFEVQHNAMAEAMWTGNYEAIAFHVDLVTKQLGEAKSEMYLTDETGRCLLGRDRDGRLAPICEVPSDLMPKSISDKAVRFDSEREAYVYSAPLSVGPVSKGHLIAVISDPYEFYRGSLGSVLWKTLPPALILVLFVWFLWLGLSRRFLLKPYLQRQVAMERKLALAQMASQVAHDIRSPLSALNIAITYAQDLPEDIRTMIRSAVGRIQDIAQGLLEKRRELESTATQPGAQAAPEAESVQLVSGLLESLLTEKRVRYAEKGGVEIEMRLDASAYGLFAKVKPTQFKRVLSNLVDNAVEAIEAEGKVRIGMSRAGSEVVVTVTDDGKGIPETVLPALGREGMSFGKPGGSGLGLFHATQTVSQWNGRLDIASAPGKGTVVTLSLPRAETPSWFLTELRLADKMTVVILDDDPSIHGIWKERIGPLGNELVSFVSGSAFAEWHAASKPTGPIVYLFDYELLGQDANGPELIERLGIAAEAVLVTSRFEEPAVLAHCRKLSIRILPKNLAGMIPCLTERKAAEAAASADRSGVQQR